MKPKSLPVDSLVLDAGTQSRVAISESTVEEYAEILGANGRTWPFPPLVVYHDGSRHVVASGFHRALAARRVEWRLIPCEVRQGTAWDALLYGMSANDKHGLRPTQADRRRNVELLLDGDPKLTQEEIAAAAGVTSRTVRKIVAERGGKNRKSSGFATAEETPEKGAATPAETGEQAAETEGADPFGDEGEDGRTDSEGQDDPSWEAPPPAAAGVGRDAPVEPPRDEFALQRSKTIKTAEALVRAFDDLHELRKSREHKGAIAACQRLIETARNWKS